MAGSIWTCVLAASLVSVCAHTDTDFFTAIQRQQGCGTADSTEGTPKQHAYSTLQHAYTRMDIVHPRDIQTAARDRTGR